jgi:sporulation protein YlmC with PRC-barrel domain
MYRSFTRAALALGITGLVALGINAAEKEKVVTTASGHHHCRVSKIEDMKVQNSAGEDIGKIKDLVVDINSGKIVYAALDFGGFLGIGDKYFAVPWNAMAVHDTQKPNEHVLVLNVSKDRLKNAPGFDKNHWPDMANPDWSRDVDRYYTPEGNAQLTR